MSVCAFLTEQQSLAGFDTKVGFPTVLEIGSLGLRWFLMRPPLGWQPPSACEFKLEREADDFGVSSYYEDTSPREPFNFHNHISGPIGRCSHIGN